MTTTDLIVPRAQWYVQDNTGTPVPLTLTMLGTPDFTPTNTRLDTTNSALGNLQTQTASTITAIGTLSTKTDATNTKLDLLATYQDGLETAAATTNTALGTLTAKFPTALGQLTKAGSLSVTPASDAPGVALATPAFHKVTDGTNAAAVKAASTAAAATDPALVVTMSPNSTPAKFRAVGTVPANPTITTGGTAQQALAANGTRNFLLVQNTNTTGDLWFNVSGTAAIGTGIKLTPGNAYEYPSHFTPTGAVSIIGATTGQTYTIQEA